MKRLILIAALVAAPVFADSWAILNKSGGEIVVNDKPCPGYPKLRQAYNYGEGGRSMNGCWYIQDDMVKVVWDDGTTYAYPASSFYKKHTTTKKGTSL